MNKLLIKQSLTILKNNPMKILNIFNIKKLYKFGLNILFNQVTNFQNLPKTRQINILNNSYSTLKKINDKITKKKNIFDKKFEDLKKENLNKNTHKKWTIKNNKKHIQKIKKKTTNKQ